MFVFYILTSSVGGAICRHTSHHDRWGDLLHSCSHFSYSYSCEAYEFSLVWCNDLWRVWNSDSWCSSDVRFASRLGGVIGGCL